MPTSYTSLIGLALPATGELSGTWGDTVNNYITQYTDAAIAGAQVISGSQTSVTLSTTNGSSLVQAGSGSSTGSAQYQIIRCTGSPASTLVITVPAADKTYLVINATSTSQSVTIRGAGPTTGVTIAAATQALVAWNGSDYVRVASNRITDLTGTLAVANGGTGSTTAQTAINTLAGATTSGQYLRGNGTNVVMSAIQSGDVTSALGYTPPQPNGTGASGTWAINITGNAATASSASTSSAVTINYGNDSNSTYYMLWGSGNGVYATGGIYCNPYYDYIYASDFIIPSDERLKTDWESLPVDFIERLAEVKVGTYTRVDTGARQLGVTAQSLRNAAPNAVHEGADGYLTASYANAALAACVELSRKVIELQERIKVLEAG